MDSPLPADRGAHSCDRPDRMASLRIFAVPPAAMITDHRPHGDGLIAFSFIRELAARGHELHVAAGRVELRADVPAGVHIHRLSEGEPTKMSRLRFAGAVRRLYGRLSSSTSFDLVHQLTPVEVGVSLALADTSTPLVLGPYVPDWPASGVGADRVVGPRTLRVKRALRAAQQRRATTVLLSTPAAASKLEQAAGKGLRVHELPLGVDDRAWLPADSAEAGQDVLFLANLEVRKGIHVLLDAFARLSPAMEGARLVIAGDGPEHDAVRRRVEGSPELRRVELRGRLDRAGARAAMQACDIYCLPSYGDPCPLAAVEAMACARPVVATDAGGLRHLVPDAGGRKVPPGNPAALAEALAELLADPPLRRAMGQHNRRVVEQRYAWPRVVDRLEDVYREAIREPLPPLGAPLRQAR